jgi:hypothetical protein
MEDRKDRKVSSLIRRRFLEDFSCPYQQNEETKTNIIVRAKLNQRPCLRTMAVGPGLRIAMPELPQAGARSVATRKYN